MKLRLADESQERPFASIVDVVRIEEKLAAHISHHRTMPRQNHFKRDFILAFDESFQKLSVRNADECSIPEDSRDLSQSAWGKSINHRRQSLLRSTTSIPDRCLDVAQVGQVVGRIDQKVDRVAAVFGVVRHHVYSIDEPVSDGLGLWRLRRTKCAEIDLARRSIVKNVDRLGKLPNFRGFGKPVCQPFGIVVAREGLSLSAVKI